jgi:Putative copper export protein
LTALFALAAPAFAHAVLEGASPAPQATLSSSPRSITLDFSEKVDVRSDGIRLLNNSGSAIDTGAPVHPGGRSSVVRVSVPKLDKGLYTVAWRAVSADSHPVQGAYTFGYGADASSKEARQLTANASAGEKGSSTVGVLFGVMRFGVFAGLALLLGAGWFAAYLWPEGRQVRRVRQLLLSALVLTGVSTALGFLLQGPYTSGKGLGDLFSSDQISAVWDTRFGKVWMARLVLLVVAALLLRMMVRHRGPLPGWWFAIAGATGLALSATPGLAGHASTGRWTLLALPADMFHVLGMSIWLGGLVMLAIARTDEHSYARVAERFSGLALGAVVVLVITGTFQSIRQLQPISSLWDSNYGRLLIAKLVAFGVVLLIAAWSRRLVHGPGMGIFSNSTSAVPVGAAAVTGGIPPSGDGAVGILVRDDAPPISGHGSGGHQSRLRRSVRGELIFGAVVLAFTAMLVNTSPPHSVAASGPLQAVMKAGKVDFEVHLDPASSVQPNIMHITVLDRAGLPRNVVEMRASLSMPSRGIPPIDVKLTHDARGVYFGDNFRIPFPGAWKLTLNAFVTDVDSATASTPVNVGGT